MRLIDLDYVFEVPVCVPRDDELSRLRAIIRRLETATPLPLKLNGKLVKHGRWNYTPDYAEYCSECGGYPDEEANHHYDYCPFCGARMDGDYGEEKPE